MSVQTLYTAATGMLSLEKRLDVIANNLANINTTAFKRDRANFEDLFYRHEVLPGAQDNAGNPTPNGISIGLGSKLSSIQSNFKEGAPKATGKELDMLIEGSGFFQVIDPSGNTLYTRAGNFSINANGQIVLGSASSGRLLDPAITVPPDFTELVISPDGSISARQAGNSALNQLGQIQLARFPNPAGLLKLGENLYAETDASGSVVVSNPGTDGTGNIKSGFLENSNVEPVNELIDLITTQRAFELNSKAVQAGDEMLALIANLRR